MTFSSMRRGLLPATSQRAAALSTLPYRIRVPLNKLKAAKTQPAERDDMASALGHGESLESSPSAPDYVRLALMSRVYDMVTETPLQHAPGLSATLGANVHLKREDLNPSFSFYIRGAYAKLARLKQQGCRGVITVSVGSRGHALACAAQATGVPATIVVPDIVPEQRRLPIMRKGARLIVAGSTLLEAKAEAARLTAAEGLEQFEHHDDPLVIAGQATVGMEILRQHSSRLSERQQHAAAAVAAAVKQIAPAVKVVGVEPAGVDVLRRSLMSGARVRIAEPGVDGIWVPQLGEEVYRLCDGLVDDIVTVSDAEISAAIRDCFEDTRALLEPAGATSVAGLKKWAAAAGGGGAEPRHYVAVASDACNIEFDFLGNIHAGAGIVSIGDLSSRTGAGAAEEER